MSAENKAGNAKKANNKGRRAAWTDDEDARLAQAWLDISEDETKGNYQKGDAFWEAVHARFVASYGTDKSACKRDSHRSLETRWKEHLQRAINRFCACYAQVVRLKPSGTNEEDWIAAALEAYKIKAEQDDLKSKKKENTTEDGDTTGDAEKSSNSRKSKKYYVFTQLDAWRILRDRPKWTNYDQPAIENSNAAASSTSSSSKIPVKRAAAVEVDEEVDDLDARRGYHSGVKRAKRNSVTESAQSKQAQASLLIAEETRRKNEIMQETNYIAVIKECRRSKCRQWRRCSSLSSTWCNLAERSSRFRC
jgi:hypothetical protein